MTPDAVPGRWLTSAPAVSSKRQRQVDLGEVSLPVKDEEGSRECVMRRA